jgi:putative transposon-encoded protein
MTLQPLISSERNLSPQRAQKLIEIQDEIIRIEIHRVKHLTMEKNSRELDPSCKYCSMNSEGKLRKDLLNAEIIQESSEPKINKNVLIRKEISKSSAQFNDLERTVDDSGKRGQIIVPRTWVGRRVKVILL